MGSPLRALRGLPQRAATQPLRGSVGARRISLTPWLTKPAAASLWPASRGAQCEVGDWIQGSAVCKALKTFNLETAPDRWQDARA